MHRGVWFKDGHSEKSIIENETRKTFFKTLHYSPAYSFFLPS